MKSLDNSIYNRVFYLFVIFFDLPLSFHKFLFILNNKIITINHTSGHTIQINNDSINISEAGGASISLNNGNITINCNNLNFNTSTATITGSDIQLNGGSVTANGEDLNTDLT